MYCGDDNLCFKCEHFCSNNYDGLGCGCRAFPNGIPDDVKCWQHTCIFEGQVGTYVFKELPEEVSTPFKEYVDYIKKHKL